MAKDLQIKFTKIGMLLILCLTLLFECSIDAPQKIDVLILSGSNNHNWQETTSQLKSILEDGRRFNVSVTNDPASLKAIELNKYDVIISNWNTWPDVTSKRWKPELEKALLEFISNGGGYVNIHAGSSSLHDWEEYQKISLGTWELGKTSHGPIHIFKVDICDISHPITKGIPDFYIKDELWHNTKFQSHINILASSHSSKENGGSGDNEPVLVTGEYGKGRCFYSVLGHNKYSMKNNAWKTLILRGIEWTATGEITIDPIVPWPDSKEIAKQSEYRWIQNDSSISLHKKDKILWQFNMPKTGKPYFHPINSEKGNTLTWFKPEDHPWHYGLWFSWKYIDRINYWEEDIETGLAEGLTIVSEKEIKLNSDLSADIMLSLVYVTNEKDTVLIEERNIAVSSPEENGDFYIDWESAFVNNKKGVLLERTPIEGQKNGRAWGGYATLGLRIDSRDMNDIKFLNNEGKTGLDIHKSPTKWTDISGRFGKNEKFGISVFEHPLNPRYPYPGYVIDGPLKNTDARFIYTGSGFLYNDGYKLNAEDQLNLRYRIDIHNSFGNIEEINIKYNKYIQNYKE